MPPPKPKRYGVAPTQFRLTADELAEADAIANAVGLSNRTEAVRFALRQTAKKLKLTVAMPEKESGNKS